MCLHIRMPVSRTKAPDTTANLRLSHKTRMTTGNADVFVVEAARGLCKHMAQVQGLRLHVKVSKSRIAAPVTMATVTAPGQVVQGHERLKVAWSRGWGEDAEVGTARKKNEGGNQGSWFLDVVRVNMPRGWCGGGRCGE